MEHRARSGRQSASASARPAAGASRRPRGASGRSWSGAPSGQADYAFGRLAGMSGSAVRGCAATVAPIEVEATIGYAGTERAHVRHTDGT
ncbi:hypothetical protein SAURM35S_04928 [Streptomyces aurantiogriseus]